MQETVEGLVILTRLYSEKNAHESFSATSDVFFVDRDTKLHCIQAIVKY